VFENRVLRRIFGPRRNEMTGGLREMLDEELHNFKSRRMRWAEHVAHWGEEESISWRETQNERGH
jgi:hypothetical protein